MKRAVIEAVTAARKAERSLARFQRLTRMRAGELGATLGGRPEDTARWIRAAAVHGHAEAQLRFGAMLLEGTGVAQDRAAARRWFSRAAQAGQAEAMNMLGRCHELGWGGAVDDREAARWYRRSAEAGHDWGAYNYAHMLFEGRGGVRGDRAAAFRLYLRAARQGHVRAMNLVGRCLEAGWGTPCDRERAALWFQRSAEAGYFRAQYNHAAALAEGGKVMAAIGWLERARAGGDEAMRRRVDALLDRIGAALAAAGDPRNGAASTNV